MNCPVCDGEGIYMGQLGSLRWYRCRRCGMEFNDGRDIPRLIEQEEIEEEESTDE